MSPADRQARVAALLEALGYGPGCSYSVTQEPGLLEANPALGAWWPRYHSADGGVAEISWADLDGFATEEDAHKWVVSELEWKARHKIPGLRRCAEEARQNAAHWDAQASELERLLAEGKDPTP